jgi:hypothetical protein
MRPPFLDQFIPATFGIALALLAVLAVLRLSPRLKGALLAAAVVLAALVAPLAAGYFPAVQVNPDGDADPATSVLRVAGMLVLIATAFPRPTRRTAGALLGAVVMEGLFHYIHDFVPWLMAAELTWLAVVVAFEARAAAREADPPASTGPLSWRAIALDDVLVFAASVAIAAFVCDRVLERYTLSGDEWANTYQADVYAHLHAFGPERACEKVFKNWWVFDKDGRMFAQYTPGWPLVMAPFQRLGVVWLACPFMFGAVSVGVARLARRIAGAGMFGLSATTPRVVRLAGVLAAVAAVACPSALLNGASRYPHTMACACFAWMVESMFAMTTASPRGRIAWGAVLGTSAALLCAVRPLDGVGIGLGVFGVFVWMVSQKELPRAGILAGCVAFAAWGALTLVILRLQLGAWFVTGYSMSPWETPMSVPHPREIMYAFRLDKGTGYWWPCALPFIPLGLQFAATRARAVAAALWLGGLTHSLTYAMVELGRDGGDSGYGPRFHLPLVVPMAVGAGLVLAWLVEHAIAAWPTSSGKERMRPVVAASAAALGWALGIYFVAPTVYPGWHETLHGFNATQRAIRDNHLHHAVVVVHDGTLAQQAWDLVQNLPSVPDPDTLIITDWKAGDDFECARRTYGDRQWYEARGTAEVELVPMDPQAGP